VIFKHFFGHPPDSQTKGFIAKAMDEIPKELESIIVEIESILEEPIQNDDEN
jgi:hypothetical protein